MTDERLSGLFAHGTAPERDVAFARRVGAEIGRARLGWRFLALAVRALVVLTLAAAVFVTARVMAPALVPIAVSWPHFMGVPLPLVLGALAVALFVHRRRFIRFRLN
jgi:hypothetical protein